MTNLLNIESAKAYVAASFNDATAFSISSAEARNIDGVDMIEVKGFASFEDGAEYDYVFDVWQETRNGETFLYGEW